MMKTPNYAKKNIEVVILAALAVIVFAVMWALAGHQFVQLHNMQSMAAQMPELGLLSLGMMITMLSGGLDLSIISVADLCGIITALVLTKGTAAGWLGGSEATIVLVSIVSGLALATFVGLLNGFLISVIGVSPILATLGTMTFVNGVSIVITHGYTLSGLPSGIAFIGNGQVLGIPVAALILLSVLLLLALVLNRTKLGFYIYLLGSNPVATRFAGVNNTSVLMRTYMISGIVSGIAGLIMISRFNSANPSYGAGYLLIAILVVVLGGVKTEGGFGRILGVFLALVILQFISNGLILFSANGFITKSIWGIVLILVMAGNLLLRGKPNA